MASGTKTVRGVVVEIDLHGGCEVPQELLEAEAAYVLLRWRGRPVGRMVFGAGSRFRRDRFEAEARETAAAGIVAAETEWAEKNVPLDLPRPGFGGSGADPAEVSVVVATRDRPGDLAACLDALAALDRPPGEVIVVDSGSVNAEETASVAAAAGARTVRLDVPGLSLARNHGFGMASGSILAFLDDDCRADPAWLDAICAGFDDPAVEAVTGQLLPGEIATEAQRAFLGYSHMDRRGFLPARFDAGSRPSRYWPVDTWRIGSGGNLAVRADCFRRLGGFSEQLGLGTDALGGEDLFLLWSVIRDGGTAAYRPEAMAWHRHHREMESLERVMFGYGAGHAAYLRAIVKQGAPRGTVLLYRLSFLYDRLVRLVRSAVGAAPYPSRLVRRELAGSFAGSK